MEDAQLDALEKEKAELEKYRGRISEITLLSSNIRKYREGNYECLGDQSYPEALRRLATLRCLQNSTSKKVREKYARSKEI